MLLADEIGDARQFWVVDDPQRGRRPVRAAVRQGDVAAELDPALANDAPLLDGTDVGVGIAAVQGQQRYALAFSKVIAHHPAKAEAPRRKLVYQVLVVDAHELKQAIVEDRRRGGRTPGVLADGGHQEAERRIAFA